MNALQNGKLGSVRAALRGAAVNPVDGVLSGNLGALLELVGVPLS